MPKDEPTQRTQKGVPVPTRKDWNDTLVKVIKPAREDEKPADEADEG
jgi:hypothetical protein